MTSKTKTDQVESMRKYRHGVAKRLDRIERGVETLTEAVTALLAERTTGQQKADGHATGR